MKYKKKMELSNKLFLIGLGLLSAVAVGTTFAATPHVSTLGYFDNFYDFKGYHIYAENLVDTNEASSAETGKEINADAIIENAGDIPVLVRISYLNVPADKVFTNNEDCGAIDKSKLVGLAGKNFGEVEIKDGNGKGTGVADGTIRDYYTGANWSVRFKNCDKFEYYRGDGCYYYKGILGARQSIQHLDGVTLTSEVDSSTKEQTFYKTGDYDTTDWKSGSVPSGSTETGRKSVVTFGSADPLKLHLAVVIETIQATDTNFNAIEKLPVNPTASTMQGYWNDLLSSQSTT